MLRDWIHLLDFPTYSYKGDNFCDFIHVFAYQHAKTFSEMGLL